MVSSGVLGPYLRSLDPVWDPIRGIVGPGDFWGSWGLDNLTFQVLVRCWVHFGPRFGSIWPRIGPESVQNLIIQRSTGWTGSGPILGPFWVQFGSIWGPKSRILASMASRDPGKGVQKTIFQRSRSLFSENPRNEVKKGLFYI